MTKCKTTLILATVLTLLTVLTACGGNSEIQTDQPPSDAVSAEWTQTAEAQVQPPTEAPATATPEDTPTTPPTEAPAISYSADVFPIMESRCVNCHGGERIEGQLVMLTYEDLMAGGENGQVIVPGDADNSLLAQLLVEQKMPKRGPRLTPVQTQTILDWINQGAQNN
jgi:Planctomycete cytochrome C